MGNTRLQTHRPPFETIRRVADSAAFFPVAVAFRQRKVMSPFYFWALAQLAGLKPETLDETSTVG